MLGYVNWKFRIVLADVKAVQFKLEFREKKNEEGKLSLFFLHTTCRIFFPSSFFLCALSLWHWIFPPSIFCLAAARWEIICVAERDREQAECEKKVKIYVFLALIKTIVIIPISWSSAKKTHIQWKKKCEKFWIWKLENYSVYRVRVHGVFFSRLLKYNFGEIADKLGQLPRTSGDALTRHTFLLWHWNF